MGGRVVGRSSRRALTETRLWVNNLAAGSMTEKEPLSHLQEGMQRVQIIRAWIALRHLLAICSCIVR